MAIELMGAGTTESTHHQDGLLTRLGHFARAAFSSEYLADSLEQAAKERERYERLVTTRLLGLTITQYQAEYRPLYVHNLDGSNGGNLLGNFQALPGGMVYPIKSLEAGQPQPLELQA